MEVYIFMLIAVFCNLFGVFYFKKIEIASFSLNNPLKFFTSIFGDQNLWKGLLISCFGYLFYILVINKNSISKLPSLLGFQILGYAILSFLSGENVTLIKIISYLVLIIGILLNLK